MCAVLLFQFCVSFSSAALTLYHGRTTSGVITYERAEGFVALDLVTNTSHVFDCAVTGGGNVQNLNWDVAGSKPRFPVTTETVDIGGVNTMVRRINLGLGATRADIGIYTCMLDSGDMAVSINITGGSAALVPVQKTVTAATGSDVQLRVYASGTPPIEVIWSKNMQQIFSNPRLSLSDSNRQLVITSAELEHSGTYYISIVGQVENSYFGVLASEAIHLTVEVQVQLTSQYLDHGLISVAEGSFLSIECSGSSSLIWQAPSGDNVTISNLLNPPFNQYQSLDSTLGVLTLVFSPLSAAENGRYICRAPLFNIDEPVYVTSNDPAIFIPPGDVIYAPEGGDVNIVATVYSSNMLNVRVDWYHNGTTINTGSDDRYSVTMDGTLYTLTMRAEADLFGLYRGAVTNVISGNSHSYTVQLARQAIIATTTKVPEDAGVETTGGGATVAATMGAAVTRGETERGETTAGVKEATRAEIYATGDGVIAGYRAATVAIMLAVAAIVY